MKYAAHEKAAYSCRQTGYWPNSRPKKITLTPNGRKINRLNTWAKITNSTPCKRWQKLTHSHQEIELMHDRLTWDYWCNPANMYKLQNIFIFAKHICIVAIVQYGQYTQYTISLGLLSCEDWGRLLLMPNATRLIVFRDPSNVIRVMDFLHTIHGVWSSANNPAQSMNHTSLHTAAFTSSDCTLTLTL